LGRPHTFYVAPDKIEGDAAVIAGDKAAQISNVLRLGIGDRVRLIDGVGTEYAADISKLDAREVAVRIVSSAVCDADEPIPILVAVCMPKSDKLEWIVQKCTELGAAGFLVCQSARAVPTPGEERVDRRLARWRKIAEEAAEQCGRATIPEINGVVPFLDMAREVCKSDLTLVACGAAEQATVCDALASASGPLRSVSVVIGPEGGLTADEIDVLLEQGAAPITLGRTTLRTETAAVAAVATILSHIRQLNTRE
jgi:16S rRNA (uracil1498-N3)-methyltransferase